MDDPFYTSGEYFSHGARHAGDAAFKAAHFVAALRLCEHQRGVKIASLIDVGCGLGEVLGELRESLPSLDLKGYDVAPQVSGLLMDGVEFVCGDVCEKADEADMITLFDVFEHVFEPVDFVARLARRCRFMGFHIPLDDHFLSGFRNQFRDKLDDPGHISFFDTVSALNLLSAAGLKVLHYEYTSGYRLPSARESTAAKIIYPLRVVMGKISPWLLSKTLGGVSLMVIAATPAGLAEISESRGGSGVA